ncbi:hypothetical protein F5X71_05195 [Nocardia brasiliensis]|uniref:Recombinase A n=1 Tax=Nocardia brasiliensis TaxID=37326 RepID=A0A6G9XLH3_NOCBR|nr:hypothetical protein [Nocardia brasiliensis]QIS01791.1 hypothetical protein F5X71_05195 [Nocardia brasiliensis]
MGSDARKRVGALPGGSAPATGRDTQATLSELRKKMAAIPGRGAAAVERIPVEAELSREVLAVPPPLAELLPGGGLAKGSVVAYAGARSLLAGLVAAVTGEGGHAAVVGVPRLGLLAAAEMGAQLERLAVIADPGRDPVEVAAVLLDGLDLVVLGLNGVAVPPARTRVIAARARTKGSTLVVTDGRWPGPTLRLDARVAGYAGLGRGRGRLRGLGLEVEVRAKQDQPRRGRLDLCSRAGRVEWVRHEPVPRAVPVLDAGEAAS